MILTLPDIVIILIFPDHHCRPGPLQFTITEAIILFLDYVNVEIHFYMHMPNKEQSVETASGDEAWD